MHPQPGFMEVDPEEVFLSVAQVLRKISRGLKQDDVLISFSCMAPVMVLVDKQRKPLRPAILYNDLRTSTEVDELNKKIGIEELLRINGNQANIQQWAPKLLWLRKNEPLLTGKIAKVFDLSTYLIRKLTGEEVVDYTVAEEGGLLDHSKMVWSDSILSTLGLDSSVLPNLKQTLQTIEATSGPLKSKLGLRNRQVTVTSGCVDAVSTPIGLGLVAEGQISLELGTTGIIYTPTSHPKPDWRLYLDLSPIPGLYFVGGGTAASGLFYEWILRLLMNGQVDFKKGERLAAKSKPGSRGVVILPYILGERTPIFDPLARAVIFGLHQEDTPCDIIRASMEGVAYSFLHHLRVMQEKSFRVETGIITGGGARSRLFRKIMADVLGIPLTYTPSLSTTIGAAYIGYMSAGIKKRWDEVQEWVSDTERIEADQSLRMIYDDLFSTYLNLYEKHGEDFKRASRLSS
jgi:xylulokinase